MYRVMDDPVWAKVKRTNLMIEIHKCDAEN